MPQLVVDRNVIRREGLPNAAADPDNEFVLTDTFLVEMVKHPERWARTARVDSTALASIDSRKWLSLSVDEILRTELGERRVVGREELLPQELQPLLVELMQLGEEDSGLPGSILRKIADILPSLRADQPAPELPKAQTDRLVGLLSNRLRPEVIADLRNGRLDGDAKLCLVEDIAFRSYRSDCEARGVGSLPWLASMSSRFMILKVWRALSWLQLGGLDAAAEEKLRNDAYDDEYILVGSFFDGVLSAERRVQEAYDALRRITDSESSEILLAAFLKYQNASAAARQGALP